MDRMTMAGYEKYWTKYPYHFQELHGVQATKGNIREAYRSMKKLGGIEKIVQEWEESVRELAATRDKKESPTYSLGTLGTIN